MINARSIGLEYSKMKRATSLAFLQLECWRFTRLTQAKAAQLTLQGERMRHLNYIRSGVYKPIKSLKDRKRCSPLAHLYCCPKGDLGDLWVNLDEALLKLTIRHRRFSAERCNPIDSARCLTVAVTALNSYPPNVVARLRTPLAMVLWCQRL